MTSEQFFKELEAHDWLYEFSDDHDVWTKAQAEQSRLEELAKTSQIFLEMFLAFRDYHESGSAFETEKKPKPELSWYKNKNEEI